MKDAKTDFSYPQQAALAGCVLIAGVLRAWAAQGDVWLDEIWSIDWAVRARSAWDIIFVNHYDNNHILNTLYLRLVGWREDAVWYRLFSVLTGAGSVALLAVAGLRRGFAAGFTAAWLAGFSYPLILYASEARGFAPAMFFSVACFLLFEAHRRGGSRFLMMLFWGSAVLGFFSHLTFLFVYLSLVAWSFAEAFPSGLRSRAFWTNALRLHGVPLLALAFLYVVHVRRLVISGGPIYGTGEVLRTLLFLAAGVSEKNVFGVAGVLALCGAAAAGLFASRGDASRRWVFFLCVLLAVPAAVLVFRRPRYLYFRYFLVCLPFLYLLASEALAVVYQKSRTGKAVCAGLLLLFAIGNAFPVYRLITLGRGQYRAALAFMLEHTPGAAVVVGSDHDVRNEPLIRHYARFVSSEKQVVYVTRRAWPPAGPDWLIRHTQDPDYVPPARLDDFRGGDYTLAASFPFEGISGWRWFLYVNTRRTDASGTSGAWRRDGFRALPHFLAAFTKKPSGGLAPEG